MDGFAGYKSAATEVIPDGVTVMDPFHVVTLPGTKLDVCRLTHPAAQLLPVTLDDDDGVIEIDEAVRIAGRQGDVVLGTVTLIVGMMIAPSGIDGAEEQSRNSADRAGAGLPVRLAHRRSETSCSQSDLLCGRHSTPIRPLPPDRVTAEYYWPSTQDTLQQGPGTKRYQHCPGGRGGVKPAEVEAAQVELLPRRCCSHVALPAVDVPVGVADVVVPDHRVHPKIAGLHRRIPWAPMAWAGWVFLRTAGPCSQRHSITGW